MILDEALKALGCTASYPTRQWLVLLFSVFVVNHNFFKVPILSWFPKAFCVYRNKSGVYPYEMTKQGLVKFFSFASRCHVDFKGRPTNCTETDYSEPDPARPKCSQLSVNEFPRCPLNGSSIFYESGPDRTTVTSFSTFCSRSYLVRLEDVAYLFGNVFSAVLMNPVVDDIGRKPILLANAFGFVLADLLMAVCPSSSMLIALRFVCGMFYNLLFGTCLILLIELTAPHLRMVVGSIVQLPVSFSQICIPLTSLAIPWWRWWIGFETILFLFSFGFLFTVPESLRWLLCQYAKDPLHFKSEALARKSLKRLVQSRIRHRPSPRNITALVAMDEELEFEGTLTIGTFVTRTDVKEIEISRQPSRTSSDEEAKSTVVLSSFSLERPSLKEKTSQQNSPLMWRCLFLFMFMRSVAVANYLALVISSNELFNAGRHVNMMLLGIIELPVPLFCIFLERKFDRRTFVSIMFFLCAIPYLAMGLWLFAMETIPPSAHYIFFLWAKLSLTTVVIIVNVYCNETFPTHVRARFLGYCVASARSISIVSAFMPVVFQKQMKWVVTVFGSLAAVCAVLVWLLPETKGKKLPQTSSDLQTIHHETKTFKEIIRPVKSKQGMSGKGGAGELGFEK